ncbi:hypothetical protein Pmani_040260 [Petrolisthes manimaculis]|uniref:DUF4758 domain-containing protein n=1 Tax=Petrolisthes manimaculis TaxID=1843537 RepID=A0AAE1NCI6_9EUCA|nr:hypothetical protein Pmani_040260 [Petrolisthes manimaculis]
MIGAMMKEMIGAVMKEMIRTGTDLNLGFATTTRSAHVVEYAKLNTFTVGGDNTDPFSHVYGTARAQLNPVYNPDGSLYPDGLVLVEATPSLPGTPPSLTVSSTPSRFAYSRSDPDSPFVTKTVYGFLDFTTLVGSTLMVFTPQSQTAKPHTTKTKGVARITVTASEAPRPTPRPRPSPTPTLPQVTATPVPPTRPSRPALHSSSSSSDLDISFFSPNSALSIEDLFSAPSSTTVTENVKEVIEPNKQSRQPSSFRFTNKNSADTGSRRRLDLNFFSSRKKPSSPRPPVKPRGGSTLVPITIEGSGTLARLTPTFTLLPTPSEVVVSATQGFASLSVIGPFKTAVNNDLGQVSQHYDFLSSSPPLEVSENFNVYNVEATAIPKQPHALDDAASENFPTGLVTKMGGTRLSQGQMTVYETSVIGTYIDGQYAQVLQSTSRIFQNSPTAAAPLASPIHSNFETVKSVIKGSATQFITPEPTLSLPLESLFSEPSGRDRDSRAGQVDDLIAMRMRSALSKRRGAQQESRPRPDDPYVDEEEDHDLQRSGSNLRPSFRLQGATSFRQTPEARTSVRRAQEVSTFYGKNQENRESRPRFKPAATRRFSRPGGQQSQQHGGKRPGRPGNRWRLPSSPRPKVNVNRRPVFPDVQDEGPYVEERQGGPIIKPTPEAPILQDGGEETLQIETQTPENGATDMLLEVATVRSLHTFRVGTTKNTRYVTFTKTFTHHLEITPPPDVEPSTTTDDVYQTPLFENILDEGPRDVSTLPPVELEGNDLAALLETVTETFSTTETMKKTSVLPVLQSGQTHYHTLTQTYHITRVVTALKTIPPYEAFSFIPENSLNEFNGQLLAEGTETDEALLPGEVEYDENGEVVSVAGETRVPPPAGFPFSDPNLAQLAGGQFNPDVLEQQLHPQLVAALQQRQQLQQVKQQQSAVAPQLIPGHLSSPVNPAVATPVLSPDQMQQLAYLRLMNPYGFGAFPQVQQQQQPTTSITSSPVTITTDITTTSRVFRVIFNARPIKTTISTVETIHTTLTTFSTSIITVAPALPSFPFPFGPSPFKWVKSIIPFHPFSPRLTP